MYGIIRNGVVVGTYSFTTGFCPRQRAVRKLTCEGDVLAACLWLENHGKADEAEMLLQSWCEAA